MKYNKIQENIIYNNDLNDEFIEAVNSEDIKKIKSLLEHRANINPKDNDGRTALMHAAAKCYTETVESLLGHVADVNATDNNRLTALMHAAAKAYTDLLRRGAEIYLESSNNNVVSGQLRNQTQTSDYTENEKKSPESLSILINTINVQPDVQSDDHVNKLSERRQNGTKKGGMEFGK